MGSLRLSLEKVYFSQSLSRNQNVWPLPAYVDAAYLINKILTYLPQCMQQDSRSQRRPEWEVSWLKSCWAVQREAEELILSVSFIPPVISALPVVRGGFRDGCGITESLCNTDAFFGWKKKVPLSPLILTQHPVAFSPPPVVNVSVKPNVCTKET